MYCKTWFDDEFAGDPEEAGKPAERVLLNINRLAYWEAIFDAGGSIPRRLGGDATAQELSADKRMFRQLSHNNHVAIGTWRKAGRGMHVFMEDEVQVDLDQARKVGAQMVLGQWIEHQIGDLHNERRFCVNSYVRLDYVKFANFCAHSLTAEIDGLERILRQRGEPRGQRSR